MNKREVKAKAVLLSVCDIGERALHACRLISVKGGTTILKVGVQVSVELGSVFIVRMLFLTQTNSFIINEFMKTK